jgi:hypothetical protein
LKVYKNNQLVKHVVNGVSKVDKNKTNPQIEPKNDQNDENKSGKTNEVPKNNEKKMKEEKKAEETKNV